MAFIVTLTDDAEQDLAAAWLAAADRNAVTTTVHLLEQDLQLDPLRVGESRTSSVNRVGYRSPLGFTFVVVVDDTTVFVTAIWLTA